MPELLSISYSPWSERARWAILHHGLDVTRRTYQPVIGELELRRRQRKWRGPVTVPVLIDDDGTVIADSTAIARWADQRGRAAPLFPPGHDAAITDFVALADRGLNAGRVRSLQRTLAHDDAVAELVPRKIRALSRPLATAIGRAGVQRTLRKYRSLTASAAPERVLSDVLEAVRAALQRASDDGHPSTLLPTFSYADIAVAQVLAFVSPPAFGLRVGDASRRSFTDPELAPRFADVIAWRDALYAAHRPQR